jgi:nucleoid-associated protein YgaU
VDSLSRHLRQPGGHDHLPYHPGCPVCRSERVAGRIATLPLVPRWVRVGLAAAVIGTTAVMAGSRPAALAQSAGDGPTATTAKGDAPPTPTVSPKDLGKHLADPNKLAPKAKAKAAPSPAGTRVVQPGDCLWTIAASELKGHAGNRAIAAEVDRLYSLNAATIGTGNPDLIYPGQRLKLS